MEKLCKRCGQRPGTTNSQYVFDSPKSERPDLGDWVCDKCEMEMEEEHREYMEWLTQGVYDNRRKILTETYNH